MANATCDLFALNPVERVRQRELLQRLRPAADDVRELGDGYHFRLNSARFSFLEAAEWVDLERRCCPFLAFDLQISGGEAGFGLSVTGGDGVKAFIEAELR